MLCVYQKFHPNFAKAKCRFKMQLGRAYVESCVVSSCFGNVTYFTLANFSPSFSKIKSLTRIYFITEHVAFTCWLMDGWKTDFSKMFSQYQFEYRGRLKIKSKPRIFWVSSSKVCISSSKKCGVKTQNSLFCSSKTVTSSNCNSGINQ